MRAHYFQHVHFEDPGSILAWLQKKDYEISSTRLYRNEELPVLQDIDVLIVMGGPMSVKDEADYPWLPQEKGFIKEAVLSGKPVLGICLGAQLIAEAMGGKVYPNEEKEIGWFPVRSVESDKGATFPFPDEIEVFHWHGETFSLPPEARLLAESRVCRNQAFQLGSRVMGLQFHLETTPKSLQAIVKNCADELTHGNYIQSQEQLLSTRQERFTQINSLMERILEYICR